jgi:hypothetical protein
MSLFCTLRFLNHLNISYLLIRFLARMVKVARFRPSSQDSLDLNAEPVNVQGEILHALRSGTCPGL